MKNVVSSCRGYLCGTNARGRILLYNVVYIKYAKLKKTELNVNQDKCDDLDRVHFLIASVDVFTCIEATRYQPVGEDSSLQDALSIFCKDLLPKRTRCGMR
jgi:hypothetical protein